jgi:predicted MFS family arabinose efflux permease
MTDNSASKDKHGSSRWSTLGLIHFCSLVPGMAMQTVAPVLTEIIREFSLSYAQGGLLMSFFSLPAIFVSIPAGMLADRFNQKTMFLVSLLLVIAGSLLFFKGTNLYMLLLGRVIIGAGSAALFVLGPQIIVHWFTGKEVGFAIGILNTAIPLSVIIALNLFAFIGDRAGWRAGIYPSVGFPLLVIFILFFFFRRAPVRDQQLESDSSSMIVDTRHAGLSVLLVAAAWLCLNVVMSSLMTFTPDYLKMNDFNIVSAGFITSAIMWPSLLISPAIGFIMDKIGRKHTIIIAASVLACVLIVLIPYATTRILLLTFFIGVAQSFIPTPLFALASEATEPEKQGMTFGIMGTCQNIGSVLGPYIIGLIRDATGGYQYSYMAMSGFMLLIIVVILVKLSRQKQ